jgi:hypothetical protein
MKLELNKVYRARNGTEWMVICIVNEPSTVFFNEVIIVNRMQDEYNKCRENGRQILGANNSEDLIELVGDDFTENLRAFEFNGILIEIIEDINRVRNHDFVRNKVSKWEVIMKELPND